MRNYGRSTLTLHRDDHDSAVRKTTSSSPNIPSRQSPLFRSAESESQESNKTASSKTTLQSLLLAATIMVSSAAVTAIHPPPARASLDISPGTTVIETSPDLTPRTLARSSVGTAWKVTRAALRERNDLTQSLERLASAATNEVASTQAWRDIWTLLQDYGVNLGSQISVRPPADFQRAARDLLQEGKVNFIVNGQVIQVSVEYRSGKDAAAAAAAAATETSDAVISATAPVPDDEWILKVEGYTGTDPNAVAAAIQVPKYRPGTPRWTRDFLDYCQTPYPEKYLSEIFRPKDEGQRPVTYGDILVLQGTLAVGFVYAWSYAYYVNENEQVEKAAQEKAAAAKKKAAATAVKKKPKEEDAWTTPPPPADTSATAVAAAVIEEPPSAVETKRQTSKPKNVKEIKETTEEDVKVSIDFDGSGQMVITATENRPRDGVFAFLQALYFPWLGMFVPSFTAPDTIIIDGSVQEETEGVFPFLRALCLPWLGILQGK
jgi:hypothetical protein